MKTLTQLFVGFFALFISHQSFANGGIVAVGKTTWDIVSANKPSSTLEDDYVSALPVYSNSNDSSYSRAVDWTEITNWVDTVTIPRQENFYIRAGINTIDFNYELKFTYGGSFNGKGMYLANITIQPTSIWVSLFTQLNARVKIGKAINVGSKENPIASLPIDIIITKSNYYHSFTSKRSFSIRGDGQWSENYTE